MDGLAELTRGRTPLDEKDLAHLHRLVAAWGPLADLCFADLLLWVPLLGEDGPGRFLVVAQVRPTTNQTVYRHDFVGEVLDEARRPLVTQSHRTGETVLGEVGLPDVATSVRVLAIPVRHRGRVIAVLTREAAPTLGRQPGELELTYARVFERFASMIAAGSFPFLTEDAEREESPRVGDGVILLDAEARVEYASPNAVSALHRIGVFGSTVGHRLDELGVAAVGPASLFSAGVPVTEELERPNDVTLLVRCLPLMDDERVTGALVLLRDITALRRRDRLLTSKDATIREIHHRVKNNLQTISSLLRLQGRRLASPEAKTAVEESARRIRSIALVHETLSRDVGDDVAFGEVVRPLLRMVEDALVSSERPVELHAVGDAGRLPARLATPLAVVLTELVQNAVEHGYPAEGPVAGGRVEVEMARDDRELVVRVRDDGAGLPPGFDPERGATLGLSITRALVTSELGGTIDLGTRGEGGTEAVVRVPLLSGPPRTP